MPRMVMFKGAAGSVLFLENQALVAGQISLYADRYASPPLL
jgi:predicted oxidoreductase (fatty acid repression mutant protein)